MAKNRSEACPAEDVDVAIGQRLRELRRARGISLDALSARTGLSIGFLSQIERGLSSPSLRVLAGVSDVLGVALSELFAPASRAPAGDDIVVRREGRSALQLWRSGISKQLLTPAAGESALALFLVHLDPGASSGAEAYVHAGEEAGLVLSGQIMLTVEDRTWRLVEGDSFRFPSRKRHRFWNAHATEAATVIWVNVAAIEKR